MINVPQLRQDQARIAVHPAKIKVLAMGRRWGKTVLGGRLVAEVIGRHGRVAWIAPSYKNSRALWRWALNAFAPAIKAGRITVHRADYVMTTDNGGELAIYGSNIDAIRNESFNLAVLDEAALLSPEAWSDAILPTLADSDGDLLVASTPKGKNWFYELFLRAERDGNVMAAWHAPTSDNPHPNIQRAFLAARDHVTERSFRQEWLAEFIDDGAGVFRNIEACATAQVLTGARLPTHRYVIGVDWGRYDDATVFCVLDATARQQVFLERMTNTDYRLQMLRLRALIERFRPAVVMAESNSMGGPLVEMLQRERLPVVDAYTTSGSKTEMIEDLVLAFEKKQIAILNDKEQVRELQAFESVRTRSGIWRYTAPGGFHDDAVIALALAWRAIARSSIRARVR